ncbi:MAG: helix-turn-helix domain-containing protein [Gemmataceae bacterium]|nr:helix-turn-helix domain-containing protein [Gemmataceae bacterium]
MTAAIKTLTIPEVAAALQCHRDTVRDLIRRKKLKARKIGRLTRIRETDLEAYLSSAVKRVR